MNYRHVYHAGNFADVLKHVVLSLCLDHLRQKPAPFRVIDTHAGVGRYDLAGVEAGKTLEWSGGVGRLIGVDAEPAPPAVAAILAPYLDVVRAENPDGRLSVYPGSPAIAARMLRDDDRLVVNELHPEDNAALAAFFKRDGRVRVMALNGWTALKSLLPPMERRGLILVDPPFEERDDFERLAAALGDIKKRFPTGMVILWYPIKDPAKVAEFYEALSAIPFEKTLRAELLVCAPSGVAKMNGCGLFLVNPPWTLKGKLETLLPFLADRLAKGGGASWLLAEGEPPATD